MSSPSQSQDRLRLIKFLAVGVLNTLVGYGIYLTLLWVGLGPQLALALAFALGVIWNFFTHARLVFQTEGLTRLPLYISIYGLIYLTNRWLLAEALAAGYGPELAQGILTILMAALSFLGVGAALTGRVPFLGWSLPAPFGPPK